MTKEIERKIEMLAATLREANANGDRIALPSESQERADALFHRAIELVEDITGEKWLFTWITY